MSKINPFQAGFMPLHDGREAAFIELPKLFGNRLNEFPMVLKVLLENVIRNMSGDERDLAVKALMAWLDSGTSQSEIAFQPNRVLMHDTTSTPALVDIAAMRDALSEQGIDPNKLKPTLPVDVSVDHSLAVEKFASPDASEFNLNLEIKRNQERYQFLRWASNALEGVRIHPPGTGIMHTINLEQLATVVTTQDRDGKLWVVPDTMLGTDSHTPMINGIGVLGWGVGGLEAQTVMFGLPTMIKIPDVVGVRLIGTLPEGVSSTDLALVVTEQLRKLDVTGDFVEFFGPGVSSLTAGDRAVVANMAPEYGATTGFFPVDENTLQYLKDTGRKAESIELVKNYCQLTQLWFDPQATPRYTKQLEINLSTLVPSVAGPRRPQDRMRHSDIARALEELQFSPKSTALGMPKHPVAIAAITSCTNTSDPKLLITAGLLAKKAREYGLKPPAWVKTSLGPGSPAAASYLKRVGLLEDLSAVGFDIVGYGCTTCIGNSGPLTEVIRNGQLAKEIQPVAILSGNRNFPGRVHPDLDLSFIMSPALVIAFGLSGNAQLNLNVDPIGIGSNGESIYFKDLYPSQMEINQYLSKAIDPNDFQKDFQIASQNPAWYALKVESTPLYPWDEGSTALRRPPFAAITEGSLLGDFKAYPLLVLGDDVTTDHISPASGIPPNSFIADYLVERGDDRNDLNVFASRRGNWEVMMRAAFFNKSLVNLLNLKSPVGNTVHSPSGEIKPIWEVAQLYRQEGISSVVIAGERYGMGSSRDWAAKGQRLLGIRAVIASSFERIHRSNLIGMGILPLVLPQGSTPSSLNIVPGDIVEVMAAPENVRIRGKVNVLIHRLGGSIESLATTLAVDTKMEHELLVYGGVIPYILQKNIRPQ